MIPRTTRAMLVVKNPRIKLPKQIKKIKEKQGVPQNSCDLIMIMVLRLCTTMSIENWPFFYCLPKTDMIRKKLMIMQEESRLCQGGQKNAKLKQFNRHQ